MKNTISGRLQEIVAALPLKKGIRVLEIGCGSGAAAREISKHIGTGHIVAIDRSAKAITQAIKGSKSQITAGTISFKQIKAEEFELASQEEKFDLAFAIRVGAFDGRHPEIEYEAFSKIAAALKKDGRFFIDGGNPLKEINLSPYRNKHSNRKA